MVQGHSVKDHMKAKRKQRKAEDAMALAKNAKNAEPAAPKRKREDLNQVAARIVREATR